MTIGSKSFAPLLSATLETDVDIVNLTYPRYVSPKIDGIRCIIHPALGPVSRTLKSIPNQFVFELLNHPKLHGLDGELTINKGVDGRVNFQATTSGIMSRAGTPDFQFNVFDYTLAPSLPFSQRIQTAQEIVDDFLASIDGSAYHNILRMVDHEIVKTPQELLAWEEEYLAQGYEGLMTRSLDGQYKYGRSTLRQEILCKLKRFVDEEAQIIDFIPLERNLNEPQTDNLGYQRRSAHKANKVIDEAGYLGKLVVQSSKWGEFHIGSGFTMDERHHIWHNQELYRHQMAKFKYQPIGIKDKPRTPIWLGLRKD